MRDPRTLRLAAVAALLLTGTAARAADTCLPPPPDLIETGTLTVGLSLATAPTAFILNDEPAGIDPDLIRALAKTMCLKPKFVNMAFAGLFPALIAKKIDVIHSQVGITDVRKQTFDFVPVFVGGIRLISGKKTGLFFQSEADTCGSTVAIMGGSTQQAALQKVKEACPADKVLTLKPFGGQAEALNDVSRGSSQAAFVDWGVATYAVKLKPDDYMIASPILSGKGPGTERNRIGIVFRKGETANAQAVQAAFDRVVASGQYDTLLETWNLGEGDIRKAQ